MNRFLKTTLIAAVSAATIGATVITTTNTVEAGAFGHHGGFYGHRGFGHRGFGHRFGYGYGRGYGRRYGYRRGFGGDGAAVGLGLAAGALAAGAAASSYGY